MKKVIISRCAGFIGSNLSSLILKEGYTVMGIYNFYSSNPNDMSHIKADIFVAKDILDYEPEYKFGGGINLFLKWYIENILIYDR